MHERLIILDVVPSPLDLDSAPFQTLTPPYQTDHVTSVTKTERKFRHPLPLAFCENGTGAAAARNF